ncbi:Na/Pi cotransporter family protein [uncultured Tateyamaria sp.]|uniref:Na/Pi cotransporter family protein n=1 Tax=uncultured Tateyamaria sp. TaxID=455651 RepID=UPI0026160C1C|nr:Na/Pi cotransporter family protein [uncultured Tateyamaria sp.]
MIFLAAQLAAAVALLLWSINVIRTGVERAFMPELKRWLRALSGSPISAASGGIVSAMVVQSATAVALIGAGFAVSGMLAVPAALALILGADLGSALMAQVLFLPVQAAVPFALLAGILTFFRARQRKTKQVGRILIGFALVLMSLQMIRMATTPIGESEIVQSIAAYLHGDLVSAFVIAAILAWVMHSSLAAVLTFASFAATGLVSPAVAMALVIGANLGGAVIPLVLLSGAERPARIVAIGNLAARGGVTLAFLAALVLGAFQPAIGLVPAGQLAILTHILLNFVMLLVALPCVSMLIRLGEALVPSRSDTTTDTVSALDTTTLDHAPLALACAQRELLSMAETVQTILVPVMKQFRSWNPDMARQIDLCEDKIDQMHFETKIYISHLRERDLTEADQKKTLEIVATANSLEEAGDRIAVNLAALARNMHDSALSFSDEGLQDLEHFHDQVVTNGQLALQVLTTGDAEAARQLVAEKDRIRVEELRLQERHLKRLQLGKTASIETTNIHQDVLRLLKQVNAALSYVAYPIAEETGDLLGSRLAHRRRVGGLA